MNESFRDPYCGVYNICVKLGGLEKFTTSQYGIITIRIKGGP